MDPQATLEILRATVAEFRSTYDNPSREGLDALNELVDLGDTMVEAFDALDNWIKSGGFQPRWND